MFKPWWQRVRATLWVFVSLLTSIAVIGDAVQVEPQGQDVDRGGMAVFGDPLPNLSNLEQREFDEGYQLFIKLWKEPTGEARTVNGFSCIECHIEPMPGGSGTVPHTFVVVSGSVTDPAGGHIFRKVLRTASGSVKATSLPRTYSIRKTPPLFGLGLLEIAKRPARPVRESDRDEELASDGRFGWRGQIQDVDEFVERALATEIGLNTPRLTRRKECTRTRMNCTVVTASVSSQQIHLIAQYLRFLGPPRPRRHDFQSLPGAEIFDRVGCSACHTPRLKTADSHIEALRSKEIHPFSDLLAHDMGEALADCQDERPVRCSWFRTAPLWGLTSTGPPFLHDGRARNIQDAILAHGGEARDSVVSYKDLNADLRATLMDFLNAL